MRPNLMGDSHAIGVNSTRLNKKRRNGKGRMMMVKVYYSLSLPKQSEASTSGLPSPAAPIQTPANQDSPYASTSAFLAVLDPSLAPSPASNYSVNSPLPPTPTPIVEVQAPTTSAHQYTCIARLSAPIWVQLLGTGYSAVEGSEDVIEYGKLTLKTCLSAICISRPELVADPTKDYAVSAVDPYESSLNPTSTSTETGINRGRTGQGLMEGKGMLSWNLAEKREGTTFVCGRVVGDGGVAAAGRAMKRRKLEENERGNENGTEGEGDESEEEEGTSETLEVWLQLVEGPAFTQNQFLTSLRSFANPSQANSDSRASPPPPQLTSSRQAHPSQQISIYQSQSQSNSNAGDPVKRKRSRTITDQQQQLPQFHPSSRAQSSQSQQQQQQQQQQQRQSQKSRRSSVVPSVDTTSSAAAALPFDVASLQNPEVLGLLSQLFPNLANNTNTASSSNLPNFSIDSPQGQALLPAIRTLAKFYGVAIPIPSTSTADITVASAPDLQVQSSSLTQEDLQVFAPVVPSSSRLSNTGMNQKSIPSATANSLSHQSKGKGKASSSTSNSTSIETGAFELVPQDESEKMAKGGGGTYNPIDVAGGCSNCPRKKSATWRMRKEVNGTRKVMVCNPCGVYYNKHGHHRTKGDRNTSPAAPNRSLESNLTTSTRPLNTGRPLQSQLTASCESDLMRRSSTRKHKRSSTSNNNQSTSNSNPSRGILIAPPSPSKLIGPNRNSPKSIFRNNRSTIHNSNGLNQFMTSPLRSPRNRAMRNYNLNTSGSGLGGMGSTSFSNMLLGLGGAATSPLRNSSTMGNNQLGNGMGLRSGYESGGNVLDLRGVVGVGGAGGGEAGGGEAFDFSTLYSGQQSPSPCKPQMGLGNAPEYLLTASPGTALKRILSDTNIDLNAFNLLDGGVGGSGRDGDLGSDAFDGDLNFYLRSTPDEEKENNHPSTEQNFDFDLASALIDNDNNSNNNDYYLPPPTTTDGAGTGPSTDYFDSVLSSLRRDFDTRLPNSTSNALTSPSSPVPSSPCVQPRTSSATPGQKSKGPMSSGRAPPSILDSFIDGLVPAFALNHRNDEGDTPTESEGWTPLSGNGDHDPLDLESILAGRGNSHPTSSTTNHQQLQQENYNLSHLLRSSRSTGRSYLPSHLLGGQINSDSSSTTTTTNNMEHLQRTQNHQQFDFGSLPPSSPPALPSELQLATPSDFDGITPDGREDMANLLASTITGGGEVIYRVPSEPLVQQQTSTSTSFQTSTAISAGSGSGGGGGVLGEAAKQEAIAALLASFGLPSSSKGALESQLLEMLENKGGSLGLALEDSRGKKHVGKLGGVEETDDHEEVKMLYESLF